MFINKWVCLLWSLDALQPAFLTSFSRDTHCFDTVTHTLFLPLPCLLYFCCLLLFLLLALFLTTLLFIPLSLPKVLGLLFPTTERHSHVAVGCLYCRSATREEKKAPLLAAVIKIQKIFSLYLRTACRTLFPAESLKFQKEKNSNSRKNIQSFFWADQTIKS